MITYKNFSNPGPTANPLAAHVANWAITWRVLFILFNSIFSCFFLFFFSFHSYNVCIRPEDGFCCIQYQVCSDTGSFSLSSIQNVDPAEAKALAESSCSSDYISIPGKHQLKILSICACKMTNIPDQYTRTLDQTNKLWWYSNEFHC